MKAQFLVIKELNHFGEILLRKGEIIELENNQISIKTSLCDIILDYDKIKDNLEEKTLLINVTEVNEDEEHIVKSYKLVLEVKTTKKKLLELESELRKIIPKFL